MAIEIVDWGKHYENYRTRELKALSWVPLPNKHDGDGYTELVNHPNGAAHFGAWCALVQLASRCHNGDTSVVSTEKHRFNAKYDSTDHPFGRGILLRENGEGHDERSLERITRIPSEVWKEALPRLLSIGWIKNYEPTEQSPIEHRDSTDVAPLNGIEWNGKNGREGTVSTPVAPTRRTVSAPSMFYDFSESLWHGISDEQVALWGEAYPAVDIDLELRQIGEWCKSNGARGKKQNWQRFITNWFKRAQDRGGSERVKTWQKKR